MAELVKNIEIAEAEARELRAVLAETRPAVEALLGRAIPAWD